MIHQLGPHRLMCGDSANLDHVAELMGNDRAALIHADPPYFEAGRSGFQGCRLRDQNLDMFQRAWWNAWSDVRAEAGSVYLWGRYLDLARIWTDLFHGEGCRYKNEIIWAKTTKKGSTRFDAPGKCSGVMTLYPRASERCLFFTWGEGGPNPVAEYMKAERKKAGLMEKDIVRQVGTFMPRHWFSTSQFTIPTQAQYVALRELANGKAFLKPYTHLQRMRQAHRNRITFDNTHEPMTDIWAHPRVKGPERCGHPTPKAIPILERILKTSSKPGDIIADPFAGSGSMLMACHNTGRVYRGMDVDQKWIDLIKGRF